MDYFFLTNVSVDTYGFTAHKLPEAWEDVTSQL